MTRELRIAEESIAPGQTRRLRMVVGETYTGEDLTLPVFVKRAAEDGPHVFITAAVHGDEINGTGVIRELLFQSPPQITRGALICVPVVDIAGFETRRRYMPDGRDLNRCFPGLQNGSLASRFAARIMDEIVRNADYGIDLHSAAATRTNYPNVRGDLSDPGVRRLAKAFGCELIVNGKGPVGSLRRAATDADSPTIILEAGEVNKFEPGVLRIGLRGIRNVLIDLDMLDGQVEPPAFQTRVRRTTWLRAALGGLLRFHVTPGSLVEAGQPIATTESFFGEARSIVISQHDGIVLGMATHPAVQPGEPVCHLAIPRMKLATIRRKIEQASKSRPMALVRDDLATNVTITPAPNR